MEPMANGNWSGGAWHFLVHSRRVEDLKLAQLQKDAELEAEVEREVDAELAAERAELLRDEEGDQALEEEEANGAEIDGCAHEEQWPEGEEEGDEVLEEQEFEEEQVEFAGVGDDVLVVQLEEEAGGSEELSKEEEGWKANEEVGEEEMAQQEIETKATEERDEGEGVLTLNEANAASLEQKPQEVRTGWVEVSCDTNHTERRIQTPSRFSTPESLPGLRLALSSLAQQKGKVAREEGVKQEELVVWEVLRAAERFGCVGGDWIFVGNGEWAAKTWKLLGERTLGNRLGPYVKVKGRVQRGEEGVDRPVFTPPQDNEEPLEAVFYVAISSMLDRQEQLRGILTLRMLGACAPEHKLKCVPDALRTLRLPDPVLFPEIPQLLFPLGSLTSPDLQKQEEKLKQAETARENARIAKVKKEKKERVAREKERVERVEKEKAARVGKERALREARAEKDRIAQKEQQERVVRTENEKALLSAARASQQKQHSKTLNKSEFRSSPMIPPASSRPSLQGGLTPPPAPSLVRNTPMQRAVTAPQLLMRPAGSVGTGKMVRVRVKRVKATPPLSSPSSSASSCSSSSFLSSSSSSSSSSFNSAANKLAVNKLVLRNPSVQFAGFSRTGPAQPLAISADHISNDGIEGATTKRKASVVVGTAPRKKMKVFKRAVTTHSSLGSETPGGGQGSVAKRVVKKQSK